MKNQLTTTNRGGLMPSEERQRKDLALYSPAKCYELSHKIRTVKDAIALPSKTLGDFKRRHGRDWVIGYVSMWLLDLNDNANVKQKMSDRQMEFTAERIYDIYPLKVTDLTLFFRNVKEGTYGPYYENISQDKIMQWLADYWDFRCEFAEMGQQQKHDNFSLSKDKAHPDVVKKMFEGVGEEKPVYDHEKSGLGARAKAVLGKGVAGNIFAKYNQVKKMTDKELKDHLVNADVRADGFDKGLYEMVKKEIDSRI